jgi:hypothetical protein
MSDHLSIHGTKNGEMVPDVKGPQPEKKETEEKNDEEATVPVALG